VAKILYFAWVRERVGAGEEQIELPSDVATLGGLADWLASRSEGHRAAFADRTKLRGAIDQNFAEWQASVAGAKEIAFFPPVTGG
jgi:sulfur-carrier protein